MFEGARMFEWQPFEGFEWFAGVCGWDVSGEVRKHQRRRHADARDYPPEQRSDDPAR